MTVVAVDSLSEQLINCLFYEESCLTGYFIPQKLQRDRYYGVVGYVGPGYGRLPLSASVYVRLTAPWMQMARM